MKQCSLKLSSILLFFVLSTSFNPNPNLNSKPYIPGEKLVYIAHFGWLNAGEAIFTIRDSVFEGRNLYHAVAEANSICIADKIFEVRDVYESFFRPENNQTYLAIRNINEGRYRYYNEVRYDYKENKVLSQKSGEHDVPENIIDILGAFYYFRESMTKQIKNVGDELILDTYFADELFPLKMRYVGDEKIKTKLGKFNSMKFSPVVEPGRIFDSEDDVTIWISKDKNYIPLQIRIDLIIGSIKCDLVEYSGLQYKLEPRK
ncbi:MAG: DUF3108 domain-containing protein [Bacteroidales bacterium]|jgi:hypothetical protein|nr:DUF3108 domain-containing protein [Bacteroidales bacterium]